MQNVILAANNADLYDLRAKRKRLINSLQKTNRSPLIHALRTWNFDIVFSTKLSIALDFRSIAFLLA